jgi:hypothetical protein
MLYVCHSLCLNVICSQTSQRFTKLMYAGFSCIFWARCRRCRSAAWCRFFTVPSSSLLLSCCCHCRAQYILFRSTLLLLRVVMLLVATCTPFPALPTVILTRYWSQHLPFSPSLPTVMITCYWLQHVPLSPSPLPLSIYGNVKRYVSWHDLD